jgi:2-methylcitrate dehydratase PrpD
MRLGTRLPTTTEEAQFNQAWPLAAMLVDGEIGPNQTLEFRLSDPQIRELAQKVEAVEDAEVEALFKLYEQGDPKGRFASKVTITLKDGRMLHSGLVDGGLRFPPTGWSEERMVEKFRWLAGFVMEEQATEEVLKTLFDFPALSNVRELTGQIQANRRKEAP